MTTVVMMTTARIMMMMMLMLVVFCCGNYTHGENEDDSSILRSGTKTFSDKNKLFVSCNPTPLIAGFDMTSLKFKLQNY